VFFFLKLLSTKKNEVLSCRIRNKFIFFVTCELTNELVLLIGKPFQPSVRLHSSLLGSFVNYIFLIFAGVALFYSKGAPSLYHHQPGLGKIEKVGALKSQNQK
jgi:hypothetical protein